MNSGFWISSSRSSYFYSKDTKKTMKVKYSILCWATNVVLFVWLIWKWSEGKRQHLEALRSVDAEQNTKKFTHIK